MGEERKPFLDVSEVAELLGWSESTIRDHLCPVQLWKRDKGEVPSKRIGKRYKIPRWWVEEVLREGTQAPDEDAA